jgi:hypothetical protein
LSSGALASIAVASATFLLAIFTLITALAAKKEANATKDLAEEAREDRELAWRPCLDFGPTIQASVNGADQYTFTVTNLGGRPAIACVCIVHQGGLQGSPPTFSLRRDEPTELKAQVSTHVGPDFPLEVFDPPNGRPPEPLSIVVLGKDVLGNRWRFLRGFPPDGPIRKNDPNPPRWATWPLWLSNDYL